MTNNIQIFNNAEFGNIRTIYEDDKVLFCGKDVAAALGYEKPRNAIERHCRGALKRGLIDSLGREQEAIFIPEGDLYRLICNSKLPSAQKFERWVFDEVLPTIRKTGAYSKLPDFTNPVIAARAWADEVEQKLALAAKIEEDKPKVLFADAVETSKTDILVGDFAKILKQNGIDTGQRRLFAKFRDGGWLIKQKGESWNMPTQKAMDMGLFRLKERTINNPDGTVRITRTAKITGKGQIFFLNKFLKEMKGE